MKIIPIVTALAAAGGTYTGIRKTKLPIGAQIGISLAAGGVGYFVGNKVSGLLMPSLGKQFVGSVQTEADKILKGNLKLPPDQQTKASYSPAQMKTYALSLFNAMDGAGSNEEEVDKVFKAMNNDLDMYLLIDAFGTRAGTSFFANSTPEDLATWLTSDGLTSRVNKLLDTKAKISFRF